MLRTLFICNPSDFLAPDVSFLFLKLTIILFLKRQVQWKDVKLFWIIVDNEKVDLDRRLLKNKLEQSKVCSTHTELQSSQ